MLVADLRERMSHREYLGWKMHYQLKAQREELEMLKAESRS